jgi:hypothetical protein
MMKLLFTLCILFLGLDVLICQGSDHQKPSLSPQRLDYHIDLEKEIDSLIANRNEKIV